MAAINWASLTDAGAFVVGAVLAALAVLWVLRMVLRLFEADPQFRHRSPMLRRRDRSSDEESDDPK